MNINKISTEVNTNQSGSTVPIRGYSVVRTHNDDFPYSRTYSLCSVLATVEPLIYVML
jgi:hypothetical protein